MLDMGRREFIRLLGGAVVAWPSAAVAQTTARIWKIGVLANEAWPPLEGLRHGLRDLGYVERLPALLTDLVGLRVRVIAAFGDVPGTSTIPVVVMAASDPVEAGLVGSLNRPGGNITGISMFASDLMAKRIETLTELVPVARMLAPKLGQRLGKPFAIENRPGDGTVSAATALAKATPDGHTLMRE